MSKIKIHFGISRAFIINAFDWGSTKTIQFYQVYALFCFFSISPLFNLLQLQHPSFCAVTVHYLLMQNLLDILTLLLFTLNLSSVLFWCLYFQLNPAAMTQFLSKDQCILSPTSYFHAHILQCSLSCTSLCQCFCDFMACKQPSNNLELGLAWGG